MSNEQIPGGLEERVKTVLRSIGVQGGEDIVSSGLVYGVVATSGVVRVLIDDDRFDLQQIMESELPALIEDQVGRLDGVTRVVVKPKPKSICTGGPIPGVRHIVGVHSVKGGVGKSTVTAYLALALARSGYRVGLLDADVYGPSAPILFGLSGEAEVDPESNTMLPFQSEGIRIMSLGFMLPDDEPLIWRGNLVDEGMPQLFREVRWGELDVLLIDMPPGTGDVPIAVARHAPLAGVLTVTAPSELSVVDVRRGLEFFADIKVPILGLIENMASYACDCGEVIPLFGRGAGKKLSEELGVPLLASLPFDEQLVAAGEEGRPLTEEKNNRFLEAMSKVAATVMMTLDEPATRGVVH